MLEFYTKAILCKIRIILYILCQTNDILYLVQLFRYVVIEKIHRKNNESVASIQV